MAANLPRNEMYDKASRLSHLFLLLSNPTYLSRSVDDLPQSGVNNGRCFIEKESSDE